MALRSTARDFFIQTIPNKVKCNLCSAVLSTRGSSTSSMTRHLRLKHSMICLKEPRSRSVLEMKEEDNNFLEASTPSVSMTVGQNDIQRSCSVALRSTVWDYFIRTFPNKVKCTICSSVLSTNGSTTSNMTRHLRLKHSVSNSKESHSRPALEMEEENNDPLQAPTPSVFMTVSQNEDVQPAMYVTVSQNEDVQPSLFMTVTQAEDVQHTESMTVIENEDVQPSSSVALRSTVWDYFIRTTPNKVKCSVCSSMLSTRGSSTSNMNRHLRLKHSMIDLKDSRSRPALETEEENDDPLQASTSSVSMTVSQNEDDKITKSACQNSISGYTVKPLSATKRAKIDKQLLRFIIKGYHPFTMVECPEFKKLLRLLDQNYDPPSSKTLSDSLLPKMYDRLREEVRKEIETASFISLTVDGWTSLKDENFFSVTAHLIDNACCFKSYLLSSFKFYGMHTSETIASELKRITEEWGIQQKIVACTTNNDADMVSVVQLCSWWHVPCFAHGLKLVVQNSLEAITETRAKVTAVAEFFKHSPEALEKLYSLQKQMGCAVLAPKQDCLTKWNSTYEMLKSLLEMKEPIQSAIAIIDPDSLLDLTNEDWLIIEKSSEVLASFDGVMKEISSEKAVTLSKAILLSTGLLSYCQELKASDENNDVVGRLISKLSDEVYQRLVRKYEELCIAWEALLLDPRFKSKGFSTDEERFETIKETIVDECCAIRDQHKEQSKVVQEEVVHLNRSASSSAKVVWKYFDAVESGCAQPTEDSPRASSAVEMDKYLSFPLLPRLADPLQWWKEHKEIFPTLYKIMERRLCILATVVPSERIFPKQGQTISQPSSKMMFLNFNMK